MRRGLLTAPLVPLLVATGVPATAATHRRPAIRFGYLGETELPHA